MPPSVAQELETRLLEMWVSFLPSSKAAADARLTPAALFAEYSREQMQQGALPVRGHDLHGHPPSPGPTPQQGAALQAASGVADIQAS